MSYLCGAMSAKSQGTLTENSVQIVLIGATGSGKSSSGNTILGQNVFKSEASANSVTQECQTETEIVNGRQVTVVDTPGWDCTALAEPEVMSQLKQALQSLHGPFSFLLVIRVGSMETAEEMNLLYILKSVLGSSFLNHTTILFTRSDDLEGKSFKDFIKEGGKEFSDLVKQCGDRCHFWNNRDTRCNKVVEKLLKDLKKSEVIKPSSHGKMSTKEENPSARPFSDAQHENVVTNRERTEEPIEDHIRVLFLGGNRVGKTSSIKTLRNKCTESVGGGAVYTHPSSGLSLKLVESPGFDDNPEQIQTTISKSVSDCSPGPHVIIIVLSVERFTPAAQSAMKHVQNCLGENARKHTMILFTRADNLEGKPIVIFIQEFHHLNEIVKIYENGFHALNNRDTKDETQVDQLVKKIKAIYERNNKEAYTNMQDLRHYDFSEGPQCEAGSSNSNEKVNPSGLQSAVNWIGKKFGLFQNKNSHLPMFD